MTRRVILSREGETEIEVVEIAPPRISVIMMRSSVVVFPSVGGCDMALRRNAPPRILVASRLF